MNGEVSRQEDLGGELEGPSWGWGWTPGSVLSRPTRGVVGT